MLGRSSLSVLLWTPGITLAALIWAGSLSLAGEAKPHVSLLLSKASAEPQKDEVLFRCETVLDNATGKDLTVRSSFSSVFDGLELVVTGKDGKTLAQQSYTWHQSPFAPPGRDFVLKQGSTSATLVFPIRDLPGDLKVARVRLVGTLPGSTYRRILSSETIEIKLRD
jgi:hypothetical protein